MKPEFALPVSPLQFDGDVWPEHGVQHRRSTRPPPPDIRHGNVSLIPLRGSENEMRNSVAAFCECLHQSSGANKGHAWSLIRVIHAQQVVQPPSPTTTNPPLPPSTFANLETIQPNLGYWKMTSNQIVIKGYLPFSTGGVVSL